MEIKIMVATHKEYQMPDDSMYLPIFVGSIGKENICNYQRDDEGKNISSKNPYFCELTALYWGWKNLDADYIGLAHYRRHFKSFIKSKKSSAFECVITKQQVETKLQKNDILLPKKRNYIIENLYSHYAHTLYVEPLDITREVIQELSPEYIRAFDKLKTRTSAHMFNMFIMKKDLFDEYMSWLFAILFELENRIDISTYDAFHARFYGRISELLLDVWLYTKGYPYEEVSVMYMEKINMKKKVLSFLNAKFRHEKYGSSF